MTTRIRILPENLTNKIAAGEVVERPCSVVKELVENSVDAGASEIVVEVEGGGKRLIQVTDDGCGMSREDALLALERHATSKISSECDLFGIATLGFRGEALPAIASVSRFTLATRERERVEGIEIYAEGGRIKEVKACGMAEGTTIAVRNLFFNTPARLKFMRSSDTEAGHVGEFLTRLAVSRPDIRFTYINDGRTVFRVLQGGLRDRVASLFGGAIVDTLFPVEWDRGGVRVTGLIASPECSRSAASHLYTFINGRFIRDRVVQHAILGAYRNFLERGRYPVVVIFIEVPPAEVDVNVHPTKHEVRFRDQGKVHDAIQEALTGVLASTPWLKSSQGKPTPFVPSPASVTETRVAEVRETLVRYRPEPERQQRFSLLQTGASPTVSSVGGEIRSGECGVRSDERLAPCPELRTPHADPSGYFSALTVIGQFNAAYILCQDGSDLVIIDQHAAHERVAFEQLKSQHGQGGIESQGLLFPETVELSFRETATLRENLVGMAGLGYEIEAFGGNTWLLKAVPQLLAKRDYLRILRDIVEELQSLGKSRTFAEALEEILVRIACHSVVRGVHPLTPPEISALFMQMDATDFSSNCPHGRPVHRKITLGEIERMFKRQ